MKFRTILYIDIEKLKTPPITPITIIIQCNIILFLVISFAKTLLYIYIGIINASAVHAIEPTRFMNKPNFGTDIAIIAVINTAKVLHKSVFNGVNL